MVPWHQLAPRPHRRIQELDVADPDEYDGDLAVASMVETPLLNWATNPISFSARKGLTFDDMAGWINALIDSQSPDKLMLAGSGTEDSLFIEAPAKSHVDSYLEGHTALRAQTITRGRMIAAWCLISPFSQT